MRQHWSHSIMKYTTLTAIFSSFLVSTPIAHAESCVCSTGAVVEANQRCPALNAAQQQTELNWVNRHLAKRQLDVEVDKFYSAEVSRVQQGLLDRLTCVEQQRRAQLLPEIAHFNDTRAYSALAAIENLYRYHLTANRNVETETYYYNSDNVNSTITLTHVVYDGNTRHDFYNDDRYWREREREEARRRWEESERDRFRREAIERERIKREIFERQRREEEWQRERMRRQEEQRREEMRREQERRERIERERDERERREREQERREWQERKEQRREERHDERRDEKRDDRRDSSRFPHERYRNEQTNNQQPTKGVHNFGARVELE